MKTALAALALLLAATAAIARRSACVATPRQPMRHYSRRVFALGTAG